MYRTLRDPFSRVEYLIQLEAGDRQAIAAKVPQDFLEEVFELQETLEEFRSAADPGHKQKLEGTVQHALKALEGRLSDLESRLLELFKQWDQGLSGSVQNDPKKLLSQMKELLSYRTYYKNMIEDIVHLLQGNTERREIRH
jgi:DnaJ-domain-containing protein 1